MNKNLSCQDLEYLTYLKEWIEAFAYYVDEEALQHGCYPASKLSDILQGILDGYHLEENGSINAEQASCLRWLAKIVVELKILFEMETPQEISCKPTCDSPKCSAQTMYHWLRYLAQN